jgi:hypothetical protein
MRKNRLLPAVKEHTIRGRWDKMEIPVKMPRGAPTSEASHPRVFASSCRVFPIIGSSRFLYSDILMGRGHNEQTDSRRHD